MGKRTWVNTQLYSVEVKDWKRIGVCVVTVNNEIDPNVLPLLSLQPDILLIKL